MTILVDKNKDKVRSILISVNMPQNYRNKIVPERKNLVNKVAGYKRSASKRFSDLISPPVHGLNSVGYMIHPGCDWFKECKNDPDKMNQVDKDIDKFLQMMQNEYGADIVVIDYGNNETRVVDTNDTKVLFGTSLGTRLSAQTAHHLPVNTVRGQRQVSTRRIEER